jgi:hypothetical protein
MIIRMVTIHPVRCEPVLGCLPIRDFTPNQRVIKGATPHSITIVIAFLNRLTRDNELISGWIYEYTVDIQTNPTFWNTSHITFHDSPFVPIGSPTARVTGGGSRPVHALLARLTLQPF